MMPRGWCGAALYDGPSHDELKAELLRTVRNFEERHWRNLASWEAATKLAEPAGEEFGKLLGAANRS